MDKWLTYSPVSGHGNATITLSASTLTGLEDRIATLIATGSQEGQTLSATTVITQKLTPSEKYLTFNISSAGTINWKTSNRSVAKTIEYKLNDRDWVSIHSTTGSTAPKINVVAGDKIQFRGNNATYGSSSSYYNTFDGSTAEFEIEGNIMSLINSTNFSTLKTLESDYTFSYLFYNCTGLTSAENLILPATTLTKRCYSVMFGGCTSLATAPVLPATTLAEGCYNSMLYGCTSLTTAPVLPATTLAYGCYTNMFVGCTSLTTVPSLPATTLAQACYEHMFDNCVSLTAVPSNYLPVTALTYGCYSGMFYGCSSLTTAPALPATTLANYCYSTMFASCTSLIAAPELPATTLASGCYNSMFYGCSSLTAAPALPATTLAYGCYDSMFSNTNVLPDCSNIDFASSTVVASGGLKGLFYGTKVTDNDLERLLPKNDNGRYYLPATTLAESCYADMFNRCKSLTTAPELPATTLADGCYSGMFKNCTSLTTAPELPTNTLVDSCYSHMFDGCTSLTTAPALPANTLADYCYEYMFDGCTSLSYIKCLATDISAYRCRDYWVRGVAATGTFVKNPNMTSWTEGNSGIPEGWTVTNAS